MSKKIIPLDAQTREIADTLRAIKVFLEENDENTIKSIYVRFTHNPDNDPESNSSVICWQNGLYWDDIGMMQVELRRMAEEYYDQCLPDS